CMCALEVRDETVAVAISWAIERRFGMGLLVLFMANTEWWQRGPVEGVPALLQPLAHILLQVRESTMELVDGLTESQWNARPAGVASARPSPNCARSTCPRSAISAPSAAPSCLPR